MQAIDVMTRDVVTVAPETSVRSIAELLLKHRISAVPVVDDARRVVGLVSEGDLMRRLEAEDTKGGSWWLRLFASNSENATNFVNRHGRHAHDVMTRNVVTVAGDTPVAEIAKLLETRRIKRVPVIRDGRLVGIVSRANLLHGLASAPVGGSDSLPSTDDRDIREQVLHAIDSIHGLGMTWFNVTVQDGIVGLWGAAPTNDEERAARVAAENIAGVRAVESHLGRIPAWAYGI